MYIIRRIQCKSGNVSETHLVEIETDDIRQHERSCTIVINVIRFFLIMTNNE